MRESAPPRSLSVRQSEGPALWTSSARSLILKRARPTKARATAITVSPTNPEIELNELNTPIARDPTFPKSPLLLASDFLEASSASGTAVANLRRAFGPSGTDSISKSISKSSQSSYTCKRKATNAESYSPRCSASTLMEEACRCDESSPPIFSNGVRTFFKSQSPQIRNTIDSPSPDREAVAGIFLSESSVFLKIFEKNPLTHTPFK